MPTSTHPKSRLAGALFDLAAQKLGSAVAASRWMFSGNSSLAGRSPIEALKAGDDDSVKHAMTHIGGNNG